MSTTKERRKIVQLKEHGLLSCLSLLSQNRTRRLRDGKTKQRQALKRLEHEGPREAGSQGPVGQQDGKS